MHPDIWELGGLDDLDLLIAESSLRPVLLLKHSYSCGTSAQALDELIEHLDSRGAEHVRFALVIVQAHREVSNDAARRLGIRHETPQALLIRDGKVLWHASHFRVTASSIASAIAKYAAVTA